MFAMSRQESARYSVSTREAPTRSASIPVRKAPNPNGIRSNDPYFPDCSIVRSNSLQTICSTLENDYSVKWTIVCAQDITRTIGRLELRLFKQDSKSALKFGSKFRGSASNIGRVTQELLHRFLTCEEPDVLSEHGGEFKTSCHALFILK